MHLVYFSKQAIFTNSQAFVADSALCSFAYQKRVLFTTTIKSNFRKSLGMLRKQNMNIRAPKPLEALLFYSISAVSLLLEGTLLFRHHFFIKLNYSLIYCCCDQWLYYRAALIIISLQQPQLIEIHLKTRWKHFFLVFYAIMHGIFIILSFS